MAPNRRTPAGLTSALVVAALTLAGAGCTGSVGDGGGRGNGPGAGPGSPGGGSQPGGNGPGGNTPGGPSGPGNTGNGGPGNTGNGGPGNGGPGNMGPISTGEVFPTPAGHTPLRRLTRSQYNNTIHDLLGIIGDAASEFGVDEQDAGFAANSRAPLKELQLERYREAAETLADKAVANLGNLLKCDPAANETGCIGEFIKGFGKRAFRRPLTDAEVTRYQALYTKGRMGADVPSGVSLVVSAFLQSPFFLYRIELGEAGAGSGDLALTSYEVGTRLSYFLTNSMPDDALLAAADAGKLKTAEGITAEATRLLGTPRARETYVSFFEQWLQIDDLLTVEKDDKAYPAFNPQVRTAMRDEIYEFVDQIARVGDGKLETILTSRTSYIRGPLNPIYGLPMAGAAGGSIQKKVDHPADQRAGVLTLAGVLAKFGHANQSSPIGRGVVVSSSLLCQVPPPPPPGADSNIPAPDPNVSTRVRFEQHRKDPACATCHALFDPLGVPFEIYDGVGTFRTNDGGKVVDAASELKGTKASDGPVKNALELVRKLSTAEEVRSCFARQMFRYAFGRAEGDRDAELIAAGLAALGRTGRIPDVMTAMAAAPGFRNRLPLDLK